MREISQTSPARDFTPIPRQGVNVADFLRQTAHRIPESNAVIDPDHDREWTWKELDTRADALAAHLSENGVGRRDTVLLVSGNHAEVIQSFWGIIRAGAVIAPPNAALSTAELLAISADLNPAALIVDRDRTDFVEAMVDQGFSGEILWNGDLPTGPIESTEPKDSTRATEAHFEVDENDPCWYFFTSGSTGKPKAATFTHRHLGAVLMNHRCDLFPNEDETGASLVIAPLSHGAGIHMLAQVFGGSTSVILPGGRVDEATIWNTIDDFAITNAFTVPTILNRIVAGYPRERGPADHGLKRVIYAGAPMLAADQERALERLGNCLVQYFGLAEVTGAITVLRPEEHGHVPVDSADIGTCGRARTGVQIHILDESGHHLPTGLSGEVCVAGQTVFAGYLGNDEANSEAFAHGIFHTGDVGYLDDRGYLFLTGRKSEMYISGGSNIYPREIEELLLTDAEVVQAVVVGVPDATWGEIGIAVVELSKTGTGETGTEVRETESRLKALLKSKLAPYKVPKEIHFVDLVPVTAYGKIARKDIKVEYSAGRGSAR